METLSPTSSISSTLLAECMEGHNSLLDETLSLDTLSDTLSISPVLSAMPFPKAPLVKALPPKMLGKPTIDATALTIRESPIVVVSEPPQDDMFPVSPKGIPLTPAGLCIQDWASSLATVEPPGHIPWAGAEGLSHDFNGRGHGSSDTGLLRGSDFEMNENFHLQTTAPLTIRRDRKRRAATNTKGELVFEREITLHASADNGRTERWSLQIPATTMNPELVDIMLELQNLKSFFQDSTYEGQISGSGYSNVPTPTLVLSDSYSAVPLDLSRPSSEASLNVINLPPSFLRNNPAASGTPPITIAARRGRKTLAPLDLPPGRTKELSGSMDIAYPGPPTAFLGTPSALSPQPVAINASGTTHGSGGLDIQSMIQNLRIQCAAFPATPTTPVEMIIQQQMPHVAPPVTPPKAPSIKGSPPPFGDSETLLQSSSTRDEWAFTQGLVSDAIAPADVAPKDSSDVYVSQNLAKSTASFRALRNSQSSKWRLEPRADRRTVAPKSGGRVSLSQAPVAPINDAAQRQKMRRRTMAIVGTDRLGGWSSPPVITAEPTSIIAPETPTSAYPTLALDSPVRPKHQSQISNMSNSQPPRSILRNRKSVRFASLPNRRSNSSDYPANRTVDGPGTDHGQESKSARRRRLTNDKGSSSLYQEAGPGSDTIKTTRNATHPTPVTLPNPQRSEQSYSNTLPSSVRNPPLSPDTRTGSRRRHSTFTPGTYPAQARSARVSLDTLRQQKTDRDPTSSVRARPPPAIRSVRATTITPRKSTMTIVDPISAAPLRDQTPTTSARTSRPCRTSMETSAQRSSDHASEKENRRTRVSTGQTIRENGGFPRKERSLSLDEQKRSEDAMHGSQGRGGSRMPVPLRNILTRFK